jgi:DNA sulfur modification protein DndC
MEAMIQNDEEKEWLKPLLEIREELDIQNDRDKRDFRRIYGQVQLFERNLDGEISIEPIPGPYTKQWREYWLKRVLEAQVQVRKNAPEEYKDITLIAPEELSEIRRIWLEEKHEFDDSLPKIYEEVMGEPYQDTRLVVSNHFLGSDEWDILADVCEEDTMHLELMAKLLDTERQFYAKSHRIGIYRELEKCFESSSRQKKDAIDNAHLQRNLKMSSESGNIDEFKGHLNSEEKQVTQHPPKEEDTADKQLSLSWANLKYPSQQEEE